MGVPKFYRWISERYPRINYIVTDAALLPEFDHLYLDMNGIIHGCTHPSHMDVSDIISEKDMMLGIMHYLDRIITQIVKPKVSLFMAIDGVAPRAKLNQQRSRRFRSAKDLAEAKKEMQLNEEKDNNNSSGNKSDDVFDSNCITPGTEFLEKVSNFIKYYIRIKIKEDPLWCHLKVIFSGHDIPGEGEHKIMSHIREMKYNTNYKPNTRHCIYGQDADLIMLGLVTHEPHFTILREVIDFMAFIKSKKQGKNTLKTVQKHTKKSDFQLLHLSVLREYLQMEFCILNNQDNNDNNNGHGDDDDDKSNNQQQQQQVIDLERVIDDFVFITFLVGNDFLPHMPTLDIGDNAFDMLFSLYKNLQAQHWNEETKDRNGDIYLTNSGAISHPNRLELFLSEIGKIESEILTQKEKDDMGFIKKKRKWDKRDNVANTGPTDYELQQMESDKQNNYEIMIGTIRNKIKFSTNGDDVELIEGWSLPPSPLELQVQNTNNKKTTTTEASKDFKGRYYYEKLKLTPIDKKEHYALCKSYMEGLLWCLAYYYRGCISWGWYYPYHYGPMLSDLIRLPSMFKEIKFDMGDPLTPFQQLMGCLPPASSTLVPTPYRWLMTSPDSPIARFYPQNFTVDMNGKKNPWEGVNLLPFIDVTLLKETIALHCPPSKLTIAEQGRNTFTNTYCYTFDLSCKDTVTSPNSSVLEDLKNCCSSVVALPYDKEKENNAAGLVFKPEILPGTIIPYPGFPSLNVLPISNIELTPIKLNCFGTPSKYPTMVIKLHEIMEEQLPDIQALSKNILGKSVFVNWPMMHEGKVVAVSNKICEIRLAPSTNDNSNTKGKNNKKNGKQQAGNQQPTYKTKQFSNLEMSRWAVNSNEMCQKYHMGNSTPGSGGVVIGTIQIRLKILALQGMRKLKNGSTKKLFGTEEADVPLQVALWSAPAPDPRFQERGIPSLIDQYPLNSSVLLTKGKYRGCKGTVVAIVPPDNSKSDNNKKKTNNNKGGNGTVAVKVQVVPPELPFGLAIASSLNESYISSSDAARILKIHPSVYGKITGTLLFEPNRYDIGLNLKSPDGTCVVGFTRQKKMASRSNNGKNSNNNAWATGDSVSVIGSAREKDDHGNNYNNNDEKIVWEYSPAAIRLVNSYRTKFPQLFLGLMRQPNERRYDANNFFGSNGEQWLAAIRKWLNETESAKIPRSPSSTQSMSNEATQSVQKAADVRTIALQKRDFPKESLVKVPSIALYREASTGATDVLLLSDYNNNEPPILGDRVANLCASGIPFGLRGTVVAVHEASKTGGTVEVVMDDEFIGGTTLQGACSNFRGKLCMWTHLLKITPANSQDVVDKLVSNGSGKSDAIAKIISSIERQVQNDKTVKDAKPASVSSSKTSVAIGAGAATDGSSQPPPKVVNPTTNSNQDKMIAKVADKKQQQQQQQQQQPISAIYQSPKSTSSVRRKTPLKSPARPGSMGRGKRVFYKEAVGPDKKGIGFKKNKRVGHKSGLVKWKRTIAKRDVSKQPEKTNNIDSAAQLKALLGMTVPPSNKQHQEVLVPPSNYGATAGYTSGSTIDTAAGLKAMLLSSSVPSSSTTNTNASSKDIDIATAKLKSMLLSPSVVLPAAPTNITTGTNATTAAADLKAMLGVGGPQILNANGPNITTSIQSQQQQQPLYSATPPPNFGSPQKPATAAEKLMQLMQSKQQPPPQGQYHPQQMYPMGISNTTQTTPFNFAYQEEGNKHQQQK